MHDYHDKSILVTGGTGSIGSEIVRQLLPHEPAQVRIYSHDEAEQAALMRALPDHPALRFLIGDVRDKERLMLATEGVDIIFHAAAMKHVDICERNAFEAVKTNVQGTQNVIDCAFAHDVEKVIGISTDKAASPVSVMGVTKLLAEKLLLSTFFYKGNKRTLFSCVRFGNVLWSRGSALPFFVRTLREGKPVQLTNPTMTRFFMSIPQAVSLVFKAASLIREREIFILKMPAARMGDVVAALSDLLQEEGLLARPPAVQVIGKKEGERLHEKLLTAEESENALETDELFIILPDFSLIPTHPRPPKYQGAWPTQQKEYTSQRAKQLSVAELKLMLADGGYYRRFFPHATHQPANLDVVRQHAHVARVA